MTDLEILFNLRDKYVAAALDLKDTIEQFRLLVTPEDFKTMNFLIEQAETIKYELSQVPDLNKINAKTYSDDFLDTLNLIKKYKFQLVRRYVSGDPKIEESIKKIIREEIQKLFEDSASIQKQIDVLTAKKTSIQDMKNQAQSNIDRLQNQITAIQKSRIQPLNKQISAIDTQIASQRDNLARTKETEDKATK